MAKDKVIYVASAKKGIVGGKEVYLPIGLSVPYGNDGYLPIDITAEMAQDEIAVPIPDNSFVQGKISEKILREVDSEKAKPKYKKYKSDFDARQAKVQKRKLSNQAFKSNLTKKVEDLVDRELKSKRSTQEQEDAE